MNASGVIEPTPTSEVSHKSEFVQKTNTGPSVSRYRRLAESRSITPSPTPLIKDQTDSEILPMPDDFSFSLRTSESVRNDLIDVPESRTDVRGGLVRIPSGECLRTISQDKNLVSLSPIPSSTESSPTVAPAKQFPLRPKLLNVPSILSNVVSRKMNCSKNGRLILKNYWCVYHFIHLCALEIIYYYLPQVIINLIVYFVCAFFYLYTL